MLQMINSKERMLVYSLSLSLSASIADMSADLYLRIQQRGIFKVGSRPKRANSGGADFSMGLQETGDASYVYTPNVVRISYLRPLQVQILRLSAFLAIRAGFLSSPVHHLRYDSRNLSESITLSWFSSTYYFYSTTYSRRFPYSTL